MLVKFETTTGSIHLNPNSGARVEVYTNDWNTPPGTYVARLLPHGPHCKKDIYELYRGESKAAADKIADDAAAACNKEAAREQAAWHEEAVDAD
jgi:hypothetical protein